MDKFLILLAGYPATGKSTFCRRLLARHPGIPVIAPDDIKEEVWDEVGFDTEEEKANLEPKVWKRYYSTIEGYMKHGSGIISDYPFSEKQRPTLSKLIERYGYRALTVRFTGDFDAIYRRSRARDLSQSRHLGHMMSHYHKGDYLEDRSKADALVTFDMLKDRCVGKGYGLFQLGDLIEVDATDVSHVDIDAIVDKVDSFIGKERPIP